MSHSTLETRHSKLPLSNLTQRILTALIGIPIVAFLTYQGGWWFVGLVAVLAADAQYEFYRFLKPKMNTPAHRCWPHSGRGACNRSVCRVSFQPGGVIGHARAGGVGYV